MTLRIPRTANQLMAEKLGLLPRARPGWSAYCTLPERLVTLVGGEAAGDAGMT